MADLLDALQQELELLRLENELLLGLMSGGYAYFFRQFILGHQNSTGLTSEECECIVVDALKRIFSTQERFGYEYLREIEAAIAKMSTTLSLEPYRQKVLQGD